MLEIYKKNLFNILFDTYKFLLLGGSILMLLAGVVTIFGDENTLPKEYIKKVKIKDIDNFHYDMSKIYFNGSLTFFIMFFINITLEKNIILSFGLNILVFFIGYIFIHFRIEKILNKYIS